MLISEKDDTKKYTSKFIFRNKLNNSKSAKHDQGYNIGNKISVRKF